VQNKYCRNSLIIFLFLLLILATFVQTQRRISAISYKKTTTPVVRINQIDSKPIMGSQNNDTIENFQKAFCGISAKPHSTVYMTEYVLPQSCEMPLGIAVDNDANKVWYVSTKKGVLGSYDLEKNRFDQEFLIPGWKSQRENPLTYSQVWDVKVDRKPLGSVWFTDEGHNAIWRYVKLSHVFEVYHIPGNSSAFGTTYPVSIEIDPDDDRTIYFVGTFSTSLWVGDMTRMKNGTSDGISQIPIPINDKFKGIDPIHISTGSIAYDSKRKVVWISMLAFGMKGEIIKYNLKTRYFSIFDLPKELNSPVGVVLDNSDNLWITNAGTSIFYRLNPDSGSILEYVTSKASPRVYGSNSDNNLDQATTLANISKGVYTLPYWIKKASDGSLWFNEQEGNKIARFDPINKQLVEYWIPTQNRIWGNCPSILNSSSNSNDYINIDYNSQKEQKEFQYSCGIANVLQFSIRNNKQIWFTEWSENKIGKIDTNEKLPFSVENTPQKELIIKRGETCKIGFKVRSTATYAPKDEKHVSNTYSSGGNIHMTVSGTFTSTGDLGNSTGTFDKQMSSSFPLPKEGRTREGSFTFTPSIDLKRGEYTMMIGAEDDSVSYLKVIKVKIT
jgi:virginiamycin B lyase